MKRLVSLLLMATMLVTCLGTVGAVAQEEREYIEIQVFSELANYSGLQSGWFAHVIKEKFNIGLNMVASNLDGGSTKFATMMVAGDLGDLVYFNENNNSENYQTAISAGLLLDWNANGLLENYGQNIVRDYPKLLVKAEALYGDGQHVYGVGNEAIKEDAELEVDAADLLWWGPYGRWDLYSDLGYPAIDDMEDYVEVFASMLELEPANEDGMPVYAMSLWKDWDSNSMMAANQFASLYGYQFKGYHYIHGTEDEYQELLAEDGYYKRSLSFYYTLNQRGMLDPDSLTQTYAEATAKEQEGRVLFNWFSTLVNNYNSVERLENGKGMKLLPMNNQATFGYTYKPYGGPRTVAIGVNCAYPERVMEFINWTFSTDGLMTMKNGPQGVTWDYDDEGIPYLTDLGWEVYLDLSTEMPAEVGGGSFYDGMPKGAEQVMPAFNAKNPENGVSYNRELWPSVLSKDMDPVTQDWSEHFGGALTAVQALEENGMLCKTLNQAIFSTEPDPSMDEMLNQKYNQIGTVLCEYSWKMVYANNEDEFDALWTEMVDKAYGLGYQEVLDYSSILTEKLFRERAAMMAE